MSQNPSLSLLLSRKEKKTPCEHTTLAGGRNNRSFMLFRCRSVAECFPSRVVIVCKWESGLKNIGTMARDGILIVQHGKYRFTKGSHRAGNISSRRHWTYVWFSQQHTKVLEFCVNDSKFPARLFCFSYYFPSWNLSRVLFICLFLLTFSLSVVLPDPKLSSDVRSGSFSVWLVLASSTLLE